MKWLACTWIWIQATRIGRKALLLRAKVILILLRPRPLRRHLLPKGMQCDYLEDREREHECHFTLQMSCRRKDRSTDELTHNMILQILEAIGDATYNSLPSSISLPDFVASAAAACDILVARHNVTYNYLTKGTPRWFLNPRAIPVQLPVPSCAHSGRTGIRSICSPWPRKVQSSSCSGLARSPCTCLTAFWPRLGTW